MRKKLRKILSYSVIFVIGMCAAIVVTVYAATTYSSSDVGYTNNNQSTVEGALDDLYTKALLYNDPSSIDYSTITSNYQKTVIASSKGVCVTMNDKLHCFKINNVSNEIEHLKQVFSGGSCTSNSSNTICRNGTAYCAIQTNGNVMCAEDIGTAATNPCEVTSNGTISCDPPYDKTGVESIDFSTLVSNAKKTIFASSKGVCVVKNGQMDCYKINNFNVEGQRIKDFIGGTCGYGSQKYYCNSSDFSCSIGSVGYVQCDDNSDGSYCYVRGNGTLACEPQQIENVDSSYIEFPIQTNQSKKILASAKGICINMNSKVECFDAHNIEAEKEHAKVVFGSSNCRTLNWGLSCSASNMSMQLYTLNNKYIQAVDDTDHSPCVVDSNGTVNCNMPG